MGLATYLSPVATWTVSISAMVLIVPPMVDGFVIGGGRNFIEQAKTELSSLFNWGGSTTYTAPLRGQMVKTSPYGMRKHPKTGLVAMHNGVDYRCNVGDDVLAVADGVIGYTGFAGNAGNLVTIDHANGQQSLYMHLSSIQTQAGQQVSSGQPIGGCGNTGRSTGAHLHLSFKQNGQFIDPTTVGF